MTKVVITVLHLRRGINEKTKVGISKRVAINGIFGRKALLKTVAYLVSHSVRRVYCVLYWQGSTESFT